MKKRCRECGDYYETEDKELILMINHKDIENIEDLIFIELSEEDYLKKRDKFQKVWKQICEGEEKWRNLI